MATGQRSFVVPILLLGSACVAIIIALKAGEVLPLRTGHIAIPLWFTLLALALHAWQESGMDHDPKGFVRRVMAGMAIKMFSSLLLLLVALLALPRAEVLPTTIVFLLTYLLFLAYSVARLSRLLRATRSP